MMRHRNFTVRLAVIAALASAAGCSDRSDSKQAGSPSSWASDPKDWAGLSEFTGISATGPDNVVVTQGPFAVRVEGDPKAIERLEMGVSGNTLKIGRKRLMGVSLSDDKGATVHVALPSLAAVSLTGSGNVTVDRASGQGLDLSLTGSGDLSVATVAVKQMKVDITGSGEVTLAGTADRGKISTTGSGEFKGEGLKFGAAEASVLGSGDIDFASDGAVDISIMGSGNVTVKGKAQCKKSVMGSGEVRCGG